MTDNPYSPPGARRDNENIGVDDVRLRRDPAPMAPTSGAVELAWEHVKARPLPTILLAVLSTFFGGGRCSPPNVSGLFDQGTTGGWDDTGAGSSGYEYFNNVDIGVVAELLPGAEILGLPTMLAQASFDTAFLGVIAAIIIVVSFVFFILGIVTQAAEDIYWLRILRGQADDLGHSFKVGRYLVPLAVAQILVTFGMMFGIMACLIPGIILALGWAFVGLVAVDKNLGYVDAVTASWRLTQGYKLEIFLLYLIAVGLYIGGALLFCVGIFVALPVIQGIFVVTYVRIAEPGNSYLVAGESPGGDHEVWEEPVSSPEGSSSPSTYDDDPYGAEW